LEVNMKLLATTAIGAALVLAACGGGSTPAPAASTAPTAAQTAAAARTAAATTTAAPAASAPAAQGSLRQVTLTAEGEQYKPSVVEVKAGETIEFVVTNKDEAKHNMVGTGEGSKLLSPDFEEGTTAKYKWTAPDKVGDIKVICAYHLATTFTVKVLPK
jgi:serine protease DegQ